MESLSEWCIREGVPAISGVDTRATVTYLRGEGSSLARLTIGEEYDADQDKAYIDPEQINLVRRAPRLPSMLAPHMGICMLQLLIVVSRKLFCEVWLDVAPVSLYCPMISLFRRLLITLMVYSFPTALVTQLIVKILFTILPASWNLLRFQFLVSVSATSSLLLQLALARSSLSTETAFTIYPSLGFKLRAMSYHQSQSWICC